MHPRSNCCDELTNRGFVVQMPWTVAWGDLDANGHVNNAMFIKYFEHIRVAYSATLYATVENNGVVPNPLPKALPSSKRSSTRMILASISCRYRRPLTFPDTLFLGARARRVDRRGDIIVEHCVFSTNLNDVAAVGEGVLVPFDYTLNRRANLAQLQPWIEAVRAIDGDVSVESDANQPDSKL